MGTAGPVPQERLRRALGEIRWEDVTLGQAVEDVVKRIGVEAAYESEEVRLHCWSKKVGTRTGSMPASRMLDLLLAGGGSPVPGKHLGWDPAGGKITIVLRERAPKPKEEEPAEAAAAAKLLQRLRETKTSFAFDGQNLQECFSYLSARHAVNILVDAPADERVRSLVVRAVKVTDATLVDALDELLRLDPDLRWEAKGSVIFVSRR